MPGANSRARDFTRLCAPARAAEVATMCGFGLVGEERVHRQDRRRVALVQQRLEGADWVDLAEEFQLQLLAPGIIGGIGEGRHAGLAGIGDQDVATPTPLPDGCGKARDGVLVQHVAGHRDQLLFRGVSQQRRLGRCEPHLVAAADRDRCALAQQQARGGKPDARVPPVTTATLSCSPRSMLLPHAQLRSRPAGERASAYDIPSRLV